MKIVLACCPSWSANYPPYNISLLKSILKQEGHEVKNFDFNIDTYVYLQENEESINYWLGQNFFYWEGDKFKDIILPKIKDLIDQWVDSILSFQPEFIGFTLYHTNWTCTEYLIHKIKEVNKEVKIMLGGPHCFGSKNDPKYSIVDYVCDVEGEHEIINIINNTTPTHERININKLPFPDYEDYDFSKYIHEKGISLEASRGCVAKCSFCMETHFWKFRYKKAEVLISEMKEYIKKYNIEIFRFNDSLVNGNIKEFYKFVNLLCEEKLKIQWEAYARINGKMDFEFIKKIKESGVAHLSYGVESGSQKVLDDMRKGIDVKEIEQNLEDGYKVGIVCNVNWMVGFPTETWKENLESFIFLFNNRKYISDISTGMTCGIGGESDLAKNGEKYGIAVGESYWNNYITQGFANTAIHRFMRLKFLHIWVSLVKIKSGQIGNVKNYLGDHYNITTFNDIRKERIDYTDINLSYEPPNNSFQCSLYAEYISYFYAIYKVFGTFNMNIIFDEDKDIKTFGKTIAKDYNAKCSFSMKENKWQINLKHSLRTEKPFKESINLSGEF